MVIAEDCLYVSNRKSSLKKDFGKCAMKEDRQDLLLKR